jgi:hypothetical protein
MRADRVTFYNTHYSEYIEMTEESGPKIFGDASLSFSSPSLNSTSVPSVLVIIAKVLQSKSYESIT